MTEYKAHTGILVCHSTIILLSLISTSITLAIDSVLVGVTADL